MSISILITYYNELQLLKRCLASISKQTQHPTEVIIYDDCSALPLQASQLDNYNFPIRIINAEKNNGPAHGRNQLMKACDSIYFRFQDADDELFETALEEILSSIAINVYPELIFNEISSYNEDNTLKCKNVIGLVNLSDNLIDFSIKHVLLIPSVTYKTEFAKSILPFKTREELSQSEDSDFIRRLCISCKSYAIINKPLAKQNLRVHSHSHSNQYDVWLSGYKSLLGLRDDLDNNNLLSYANRMYYIGLRLLEHRDFLNARNAFEETETIYNHKIEIGYNNPKKILALFLGVYGTEMLVYYLRRLKHD